MPEVLFWTFHRIPEPKVDQAGCLHLDRGVHGPLEVCAKRLGASLENLRARVTERLPRAGVDYGTTRADQDVKCFKWSRTHYHPLNRLVLLLKVSGPS